MPLCPQCGPLLETIDKESEEEETEVKEVDCSGGQEADGVDVDRSEGAAEPVDLLTETTRPEAFCSCACAIGYRHPN